MKTVTITEEYFTGDHPNDLHPIGVVNNPIEKNITLEDGTVLQIGDRIGIDPSGHANCLYLPYHCSYRCEDGYEYGLTITAKSRADAIARLAAIGATGSVCGPVASVGNDHNPITGLTLLRNTHGWTLDGIGKWISKDWAILPEKRPIYKGSVWVWLCIAIVSR